MCTYISISMYEIYVDTYVDLDVYRHMKKYGYVHIYRCTDTYADTYTDAR